MSLAIVHSRAQVGVEAPAVTVEAHLANGLPTLTLVGLPEGRLGFVRKVGASRIPAMIGWRPAWQSVTNSPTYRGN